MTTEALYTTEVPDSGLGDNADLGGGGKGGCTGATYVFTTGGTVKGVRFYAPATVTALHTFTAELWSPTGTDGASSGTGTGTLLASKSVAGTSITAATWNVINFDTPVSVSAAQPYRHVVHNTAGRYVAVVGYYATDHTNGNVTGYQSDHDYGGSISTLRNNVFFDACDAGTYPNKFFGTPSYLVDTQFEASATSSDLTVVNVSQAQTIGNLALTQTHVLAVNDINQAQVISAISLGIVGLPPPSERIEIVPAAGSRRETILADDRTETVTL